MKVLYDPDRDILQISFRSASIEETAQITPGFILDYDEDGRIIGLEITNASQKVDAPHSILYQLNRANDNKPLPHTRK
ncbi:DUF2283 domain-containing protein [Lyngbya confervoides]|uniref:DUF2283 domain-containing protein n=1 Tax=Lyngbya confervoides BDU141951 TaxID=1574623 RepID=A0ABD4T6W1_9CYAN|nr:DUF2283 domain-containing protein [Lyngbya confervoides]MCM1984299.1 DUF2283 domain-containing protein [Lyngbya confervoides BDU141951]